MLEALEIIREEKVAASPVQVNKDFLIAIAERRKISQITEVSESN